MANAVSNYMGKTRASEVTRGDGIVSGVLSIIAIIISVLLFYTWSRVQAVRIGYEIFNANSEMRKLDQENKELILEIASLKSPKKIEKIAREELRLIPPKDEQIIILR